MKLLLVLFLLSIIACKGSSNISGVWVDPTVCLPEQVYKINFDINKATLLNGRELSVSLSDKKIINLQEGVLTIWRDDLTLRNNYLELYLSQEEKRIMVNYDSILGDQKIDKMRLFRKLWHRKEEGIEYFLEFLPNRKLILTEINQTDTLSTINEWDVFNVDQFSILILRILVCNSLYISSLDNDEIQYLIFKNGKIFKESMSEYYLEKGEVIGFLYGKWEVISNTGNATFKAFDNITIKETGELLIDQSISNWYLDKFENVILVDADQRIIDNPFFYIKYIDSNNLTIENGGVVYELIRK